MKSKQMMAMLLNRIDEEERARRVVERQREKAIQGSLYWQREFQKTKDLAERLAEAAEPAIRQLYSYDHGPGARVGGSLEDALEAYRQRREPTDGKM